MTGGLMDFPPELHELMADYDIRCHAVSYESNFPLNRDDRRVRLDVPTVHGTCYSASLEDIVVAKLCSPRETDESDIREAAVLDALDGDKLAAVAEEMPMNILNSRVLGDFRHNYDLYVEEFRPCSP